MSLTTRILLLVLLALVPALAIQGYNEVALRASRNEAVRADAIATARAVAEDFSQIAEEMRQALDLISEDPSVRAQDPAGCTAYLRRADKRLPHVLVITLTAPDGTVICNSAGSAPGSYSNGQRAYHRRAIGESGFAVGGYAVGIVTKRASVHFARAVHGPGGTVDGVLSAGVDLDWLSDHLRQSLRQPSTAITVTDRDGIIIVRRPVGADWIGRPIPPDRSAMLVAQGNAVRVGEGLDGRQRIIATATPGGVLDGVRVVIGRDRDVAFADIDGATRRGLVLIALGTVLALAAALAAGRVFIRRPIDRLLCTAAAWQAGDLTARNHLAGTAEFGRLGGKLDAMAGSLQHNEGALREEIRRGLALQAQQVTMLHELNHRVKNTLATVQALARQSRAGEGGAGLEARILSLSKTHDLLTREDWSGASLCEVLENELRPYRTGADHIVLDGPDVSLTPRYVLALGMTVHELTTNAAKYGALSMSDGRVRVTWSLGESGTGTPRLRLSWEESGGPPVSPPTRSGFGTRLISGGVRRELDGLVDLAFEPDGLCCRLDVPLEAPLSAMLAPTG